MYVGRFLVLGPNGGAYRVSSRSFPNRRITERDDRLTVVPTEDAPPTDNPYVSYNCVRTVETSPIDTTDTADTADGERPDDRDASDGRRAETAVIGNGTHVDGIAGKLGLGYPPRDALALSLLTYDFEKDEYDTPRIAGVLGADGESVVGIVRRDALLVERVSEPTFVATYGNDRPEPIDASEHAVDGVDAVDLTEATDAARTVYDLAFEHPVCACGVVRTPDGFEFAVENGDERTGRTTEATR